MKVSPKFMGRIPVGATLTIDADDARALAEVISYAHNALEDKTAAHRMYLRLAAVCHALDSDAETGLNDDHSESVFTKTLAHFAAPEKF